jgi:23S rRNA (guanine745-N1)-methyltransferase
VPLHQIYVSSRWSGRPGKANWRTEVHENGSVLDDIIRFLRCPYCGAELEREDGALRCRAGHVFNVARQGYVSLLPSDAKADLGDSAAMVQARTDFLAAGHFATIADKLSQAVGAVATTGADGCIVDVGAGTGYYLAAALRRLPGRVGVALDVSKFALRRAVRAHPSIGAVACDIWRYLPVADGTAVVVLNIFAPRNGAELRRIIHPAGRLLVVTPNHDHFSELIAPLELLAVDQRKEERLTKQLSPYFDLVERHDHHATLSLGHADAAAAAAMGPSAWHVGSNVLSELVAKLPDPVEVTISVTQWGFRPIQMPGPGSG